MEKLQISKINIENRRREDFGDIEALAESISKYGLFHPIIVDDENNLIAGERRLRACQILEWFDIPVKAYKDLTDEERIEIELEENLKRKDFTQYELSKRIASQAKRVGENPGVIAEVGDRQDVLSHRGTKTKKTTNLREISKKLGIPKSTVNRAEQHVKAVDDLIEQGMDETEAKELPQKQAIELVKTSNSEKDDFLETVHRQAAEVEKRLRALNESTKTLRNTFKRKGVDLSLFAPALTKEKNVGQAVRLRAMRHCGCENGCDECKQTCYRAG